MSSQPARRLATGATIAIVALAGAAAPAAFARHGADDPVSHDRGDDHGHHHGRHHGHHHHHGADDGPNHR
jgi:Spy/CpxP family protein refolding chaperone